VAYHEKRGNADVYRAGFRRLCEIEGRSHDNPLQTDFWRAIVAGEDDSRELHEVGSNQGLGEQPGCGPGVDARLKAGAASAEGQRRSSSRPPASPSRHGIGLVTCRRREEERQVGWLGA
jgi:hypothetical protein